MIAVPVVVRRKECWCVELPSDDDDGEEELREDWVLLREVETEREFTNPVPVATVENDLYQTNQQSR